MFLLIHSSLKSSKLDINHDDVESIWCLVTSFDNSAYAVRAFYRPSDSNLEKLLSLFDIDSEAFRQPII